MTDGAMAKHLVDALSRAHGLFGEGPAPGDVHVVTTGLTKAVESTDAARGRVSTLSGLLPVRYAEVGQRLEVPAEAEDHLTAAIRDADAVRRAGHTDSGRILAAGAGDVARTAPFAETPAGQRMLLMALRGRVSHQQLVVAAYRARAARMAQLVRSLSYVGAGAPGMYGQSPTVGGEGFAGPASGAGTPRVPSAGTVLANGVTPNVGARHDASIANAGPRECAAMLTGQARRRGYSPAQIVAMLSTMLQESGGRADAVSPNGLWRGLFQQDASYPGRDDPTTAITGFLNRLSAKGGQSASDIWKAIFWLQQAPGAVSAEAAYAHGRRAYVQEIQSQLGRATAMYRDVTGG